MGRDVAPDESLFGRTIAGKYCIEEFVGGGAMGAVYKARQVALEKIVAIKVLHREVLKDAQFSMRFKREAKAASRLDHPNSLRVLDFGEEPDGLLYMVMEFLAGKDLFEIHRTEFPLPADRIASILSQALAALAVAHDQGVIHRDLKPENIMVLPGRDDEGNPIDLVKVCDFGIAKIVDRGRARASDSSARFSTSGLVVGTPEYMSPEQGRGEGLDPRADVYSMGVILYQLLTGGVPFEAESAIGIVLKHVTEEPKKPSDCRSGIDPRLEAITLKAMQKKKDDRYASAREMRAALRPLIGANIGHHDEIPERKLTPTQLESAATVAIAARSTPSLSADRKASLAAAELGDQLEIPQKKPSWAIVVIAPLVLGAIATIAWISLHRPPANNVEQPPIEKSVVTVAPPASSVAPAISVSASASIEKPKPKPAIKNVAVVDAGTITEPIDPDKARVSIAAVRATNAADASVRSAVDVARATSCYKDGLRAPNAKGRAFQQTLQIKTDASGSITFAAMAAPDFLTSLQTCFVQKLIGVKIEGAHDAQADVDLAFSAH